MTKTEVKKLLAALSERQQINTINLKRVTPAQKSLTEIKADFEKAGAIFVCDRGTPHD